MEKLFWADRFESLGKSVERLSEAARSKDLDRKDYIRDASIKRFELTIELFWKILKKILSYEKIDSSTPRDVLAKSFQFNLIDDEEIWLKMLDDRNSTVHVYNEEEAKKIYENVKSYLPIFEKTYEKLKKTYSL